jgi:hypothetical protein
MRMNGPIVLFCNHTHAGLMRLHVATTESWMRMLLKLILIDFHKTVKSQINA